LWDDDGGGPSCSFTQYRWFCFRVIDGRRSLFGGHCRVGVVPHLWLQGGGGAASDADHRPTPTGELQVGEGGVSEPVTWRTPLGRRMGLAGSGVLSRGSNPACRLAGGPPDIYVVVPCRPPVWVGWPGGCACGKDYWARLPFGGFAPATFLLTSPACSFRPAIAEAEDMTLGHRSGVLRGSSCCGGVGRWFPCDACVLWGAFPLSGWSLSLGCAA